MTDAKRISDAGAHHTIRHIHANGKHERNTVLKRKPPRKKATPPLTKIEIPIDLFKCGVVVCIGDLRKAVNALKSDGLTIDGDMDGLGDSAGASFGFVGLPDKGIWLSEPDPFVLVHEAVHSARSLLADKGVSDEETLCYLVEYLVRVTSSRAGFQPLSCSGASSRSRAKQSARSLRRAQS